MFGLLRRCGSAVFGAVKTVAKKIEKGVTAACKEVKKVGAAIQSGWKKFTGENTEREAEKLLSALEAKAKSQEKEFQIFAEEIQKRLDASMEKLNQVRAELNFNCFTRFEKLASRFANWNVEKVRYELSMLVKEKHLEAVKSRGELFKIDFRNHPVSSNLKAIFTLGFLTRKRADETLKAVQEEGHRLDFEIEQIKAEKTRLSRLADSLEQIASFFEGCHEYYRRILDELDYSVNFLRSSYFVMNHEDPAEQFDPEMLPEHHKLCLKCADEATRILFAIGNHRYVNMTEKTIEVIDRDINSFQEGRAEMEELQKQFAA